jgi:hypothetical protein
MGGMKDIIDVDYFFWDQRRAARRFVTPLVDLGTIFRHVEPGTFLLSFSLLLFLNHDS